MGAIAGRVPRWWLWLGLVAVVAVGSYWLGASRSRSLPAAGEPSAAATDGPAPSLPIGTVIAFAGPGDSGSRDWLPCDGRVLSRVEYPGLFAAIGTAHGAGLKPDTFLLPDYRGRFLRGVDDSAGRDPDRATRAEAGPGGNRGDAVGSVQDDAIAAHRHGYRGFILKDDDWVRGVKHPANGTGDLGADSDTTASGGAETRGKNAYVRWLIRAR